MAKSFLSFVQRSERAKKIVRGCVIFCNLAPFIYMGSLGSRGAVGQVLVLKKHLQTPRTLVVKIPQKEPKVQDHFMNNF